jgi:hypothetical protein
MAKVLITHVQAAKTWLHGMEGLPNYLSCVEAQKQHIVKTLAIIRLGMADSAALVSAVRALPFRRLDTRELLQFVGERTNAEILETETAKRRQQNYEAIVDYYTRAAWERFMSDELAETDLLDAIVTHPITLGMKAPTEGTHRILASIYLACRHGVGEALLLSPMEKNNAVKASKKSFKRLKGHVPFCFADVPDLHGKPSVFRKSFPDLCTRVYADAKPFPCPITFTQMVGLQATIDCRSTAKGLRGFKTPAQSHGSQMSMASAQSHGQSFDANSMMQFFQMMAPMVRQMSNQGDAFGFEILPKRKKLKLGDRASPAEDEKPTEAAISESSEDDEAATPAKSQLAIRKPETPPPTSSSRPPRLSAVDALARIQKAVESRVSVLPPRKSNKKSKTVPDKEPENKAKKSDKCSLPLASTKGDKSSGSSICIERSRSQVLARTEKKGKSQSKSVRFGEGLEYANEVTAKLAAHNWLANL